MAAVLSHPWMILSADGRAIGVDISQVPEQVRRAPIAALRAVFAGIGRIVMSADRPDCAVAADDGQHAISPAGLPLANYDSLTLPSIRARLRGLDVGQLKVLLDYEATNAERPEIMRMYDRRIEKIESSR
jgi:hypothetical protein